MVYGGLARLRWRRRGAWMWPAFVALTIADGVIGHLLPPAGDSQTVFGAVLIGGALNLLAVLFLSRPLGAVLRRRRPDLPAIVARDYAGTTGLAAVTAAILAVGLAHRSTVIANDRAMADAIARAQAYIGDRAPAEFRRNLASVSAYPIEPGSVYRVCVRSPDRTRTYCVVVKRGLPFGRSVSFSGYEPNDVLTQGAR
ncbi:MAG TPA: hypothetical protein VGX45_15850 [Solirubrobacteraceae bacterium]|nr:hypothetical protein [Solirubrobacteraceae bacterium]